MPLGAAASELVPIDAAVRIISTAVITVLAYNSIRNSIMLLS